MAEFKHGTMDTHAQEKTFSGVVKTIKWISIAIILFLIFLAVVDG